MAIKYAENTSYNTSSPKNYSNLIKALHAKNVERLNQRRVAAKKPLQIAEAAPFAMLTPEEKTAQEAGIQPYINSGVPVSNYLGSDIPAGTKLKDYPSLAQVAYGKVVEPETKPYLKTA